MFLQIGSFRQVPSGRRSPSVGTRSASQSQQASQKGLGQEESGKLPAPAYPPVGTVGDSKPALSRFSGPSEIAIVPIDVGTRFA